MECSVLHCQRPGAWVALEFNVRGKVEQARIWLCDEHGNGPSD